MAANSRSSSKTKVKGAKKPVQKKSASKPAGKTVKKPAPKKKPAAKKPARPRPKSIVKPVVKATTIKAPQRPIPAIKKAAEASYAFDQKIDQMAKQSSAPRRSSGGKSFLKVFVGILIIIAAAALIYIFYPKGKSAEVKDNIANKTVAPAQDIKLPEPEPKKEVVKPKAVAKAVDGDIYVVKYKDQLTEISKKQYGNFIGWKQIYEANKDKIKNPHLIFPGQELVIPKKK